LDEIHSFSGLNFGVLSKFFGALYSTDSQAHIYGYHSLPPGEHSQWIDLDLAQLREVGGQLRQPVEHV
jgi:hypothetical protein